MISDQAGWQAAAEVDGGGSPVTARQAPPVPDSPQEMETLAGLLMQLAPVLNLDDLRLFLAVCETEGLSVPRLAKRLKLSLSDAIRCVTTLLAVRLELPGDETAAGVPGLVAALQPDPADSRRLVLLSDAGRRLRGTLEALMGPDYPALALQAMQAVRQAMAEAMGVPLHE